MKLFTLFASFIAVTSASAIPEKRWGRPKCLSQHFANNVIAQFISILEHPDIPAANATAQALLDSTFQETSDSILSLEGLPLGGSSFGGKAEYINGVLSAPPVEGIETIGIYVAGCDKILWQWLFAGIGTAEFEVKGFNLFDITSAGQISHLYVEFNSLAWALDTGYQVIFPPPPPTK